MGQSSTDAFGTPACGYPAVLGFWGKRRNFAMVGTLLSIRLQPITPLVGLSNGGDAGPITFGLGRLAQIANSDDCCGGKHATVES